MNTHPTRSRQSFTQATVLAGGKGWKSGLSSVASPTPVFAAPTQTSVKQGQMLVTPAIAQEWLKMNHGNRPVVRNQVDKIANEIKLGLWTLTHQGICFGTTGRLIDGQHRLLAIVKSNCSVPLMVTFGIDDAAFANIDRGQKRKAFVLNGLTERASETMNMGMRLLAISKGVGYSLPPSAQAMMFAAVSKEYEKLDAFAPKRSRAFGTAPFKFAALFSMILNPEDHEFVMTQYRALCDAEFSDMTRCTQAVYRQFTMQRGIDKSDKAQNFARAMIPFNPAKVKLERIQIDNFAEIIAKHRSDFVEILDNRLTDPVARRMFSLT